MPPLMMETVRQESTAVERSMRGQRRVALSTGRYVCWSMDIKIIGVELGLHQVPRAF